MKHKEIIKKGYSEIASDSCGCCRCQCGTDNSSEEIAKQIGYSSNEIKKYSNANMGLGCGNPVALSNIKKGDIVIDLGCGAGFDSFLASEKVGEKGRVIGIDMTEKMIKKAKTNSQKNKIKNTEFKLGDIEELPIKNEYADKIISNCVINLAENKDRVFKEAYRVLKKGGKMYVSDIVLLEPLTNEQKNDKSLLVGCVAGALLKKDYLRKIKNAGFNINIFEEDKDISKKQYSGIKLESIKVEAVK
ncbi:MAG: arsenite methyltransferase [Nanoarchaeota archaeon]